MEVIDVGTTPADQMVDLLLEDGYLNSLIGNHGAACFVLVRSMAAPGFYSRLIENSDTVDATTREHVAFIVFHGDRSGIVHEAGTTYRPYLARHRFDGLSVSGDGFFHSERMNAGLDGLVPSFAPQLADQLRYEPERVNVPVLSHHMTRAATRLMTRYGLQEADLPCLLFVDPNQPTARVAIKLCVDDPLQSLYSDVLGPLSDELRQLSMFWSCRDAVGWMRRRRERAEKTIATAPGEIEVLDQAIHEKALESAPIITSWQEGIHRLSEIRQALAGDLRDPTVMERICGLPNDWNERRYELRDSFSQILQVVDRIQELETNEKAIHAGQQVFKSDGHREMVLAKLTARLARERKAVPDRLGRLKGRLGEQIHTLEKYVAGLQRQISEMQSKKLWLTKELQSAQEDLTENPAAELQALEIDVSKREQRLRERRYGDAVLSPTHPSTFTAIQTMAQQRLLGPESRSKAAQGNKPMRILFMAANPVTTSPLDLEEELRSVEMELRGVKYRDQITFSARHAVRPDDLLRYVRSEQPTVIHFSGHGSSKGIVLRSDDGGYTEVSGQSLRRFLDGRGVGLLVLNACYTKVQADHVAGVVEAVVGTTDAVGDEAARRFTVAFYRGLGDGLSIKEAFRDGGDAVALHGLEDVFWSSGKLDQVPLGSTQS